jgi:hypothetical protein
MKYSKPKLGKAPHSETCDNRNRATIWGCHKCDEIIIIHEQASEQEALGTLTSLQCNFTVATAVAGHVHVRGESDQIRIKKEELGCYQPVQMRTHNVPL